MKPQSWMAAALVAGAALPAPAQADALQALLTDARRSALELAEIEAARREAEAQSAGALAAYDLVLFGNARYVDDSSETSNTLAGDRRSQLTGDIGVRKILPTATLLQATLSHQREYTEYPPPAPQPPAVPGMPVMPTFDVSSFQSYNPGYTTKLELTARQPLWRNFLGRELSLQQELAAAGLIAPAYRAKLQLQGVQAETEQLAWGLAAIEARIVLMNDLIRLSRRFTELMEGRRNLGRGDDLDVAAAESNLVAREGALLQLELAREDLLRRLAVRTGRPVDALPVLPLDQSAAALPVSDPASARELAAARRQDLALIEASRAPLRTQQELAREQARPDVAVFGSLGTNGLEGSMGRSVPDSVDDVDHLTWVIGVAAEVNLGKTASRSQDEAAAARLAALDAQREVILRDVAREIDLAFQALDGARRRLEQAERQRVALIRKRDLAQAQFRQARTEEIAILGYDIEVDNVEMERIDALHAAREAEARLRLALHAYPEER
jgi:outer membrane protein TolC